MRGIVSALLCGLWASSALAVNLNSSELNQQMKRLSSADRMVLVLKVNKEVKSKDDLLQSLPAELVDKLQIDQLELLFTKAIVPGGFESWVSYNLKPEAESDGLDTKALKDSGLLLDVHYNYQYLGDPREGTGQQGFSVNDPLFSRQRHHKVLRSQTAWNFGVGSSSVVIAITDDGFDMNHEDLEDMAWTNRNEIPGNKIDDDKNGFVDDVHGWDIIDNDNDASPERGFDGLDKHGTHVAGIICAGVNNKKGVVGVAPGVKIMPIRFYGSGNWTSAVVAKSYAYAANNGAKIISTSYNVDMFVGDPVYEAGLNYAYDKGVLIFNSAGNGNEKDPARDRLDQYLTVCSTEVLTDKVDRRSDFSNYGQRIDICAPGSNILSTVPGNSYEELDGTSMATPAAAGVAALIWSAFPHWDRAKVAAQLLGTAEGLSAANPSYEGMLGSGRVSPMRAILGRARPPKIEQAAVRLGVHDKSVARPTSVIITYRGVFDEKTVENSKNYILRKLDEAGDKDFEVELPTQYRIGTNDFVVRSKKTLPGGQYRLIIRVSQMKDPFGRVADGDGDGKAGGDYVLNFQVEAPPA